MTSDVERFISVRVEELLGIEGFEEEFSMAVQKTLLKRADGTFLWVGFVMNELSRKKIRTEVLETLRTIPEGLPAIYSRMLLQIERSRRRTSVLILRWIRLLYAALSLRCIRMKLVLSISQQGTIYYERRLTGIKSWKNSVSNQRKHIWNWHGNVSIASMIRLFHKSLRYQTTQYYIGQSTQEVVLYTRGSS